MHIYDDHLIARLKSEVERKKREETLQKQEVEEWKRAVARKKEVLVSYIMECLQGFPAAAKKVGLPVASLRWENQNDGYRAVTFWVLTSMYYSYSGNTTRYCITTDGDCFICFSSVKSYCNPNPSFHSLECMSLFLYTDFIWCKQGKEKIKEGFIKALSGSPTKWYTSP